MGPDEEDEDELLSFEDLIAFEKRTPRPPLKEDNDLDELKKRLKENE